GPLRKRGAEHPKAGAGVTQTRRGCGKVSSSVGAVRSSPAVKVLNSRGFQQGIWPEQVEPAARLLHLSRRPNDSKWRMEQSADLGRAHEACKGRSPLQSKPGR